MATDTKEIEIELEDRTVTVSVTVEAFLEKNYGADADGNRGESAWFIDNHGWELMSEDILSPKERADISRIVAAKVDNEDWDFNESYPDDWMDDAL